MKYLTLAAFLIFFVLVVWYFGMTTPSPKPITSVTIGATTIQVEVADTAASREQGLSGRESLGEGSGMLFVFDMPGNYGFWMKDMKFSLDILFADEQGKIVSIYGDLAPDSYKKNPPKVFYPASPAKYVLEVPTGFAKTHAIAEGMTIVVQ